MQSFMMKNLMEICAILLLFFSDIIDAKPKLVILSPQPAGIGEIVTFSCKYSITDVYVISVHMGNTILVMWEKNTGYTVVKKQITTTEFNPDSGVFDIKMNVSLCGEKLYFCRVYDSGFSSKDSDQNELNIVSPQVETLLDNDNPSTIVIKNLTLPNLHNFSCSFDNVKNADSVIVSSKNSSLIIGDIESSVHLINGECRSYGYYTSKLSFEDYGHFIIKCSVNTTDSDILYSMDYKVHVVNIISPEENKEEPQLVSYLVAWEVALVVLFGLLSIFLMAVTVIYLYSKNFCASCCISDDTDSSPSHLKNCSSKSKGSIPFHMTYITMTPSFTQTDLQQTLNRPKYYSFDEDEGYGGDIGNDHLPRSNSNLSALNASKMHHIDRNPASNTNSPYIPNTDNSITYEKSDIYSQHDDDKRNAFQNNGYYPSPILAYSTSDRKKDTAVKAPIAAHPLADDPIMAYDYSTSERNMRDSYGSIADDTSDDMPGTNRTDANPSFEPTEDAQKRKRKTKRFRPHKHSDTRNELIMSIEINNADTLPKQEKVYF